MFRSFTIISFSLVEVRTALPLLWLERNCHSRLAWLWFLQGSTDHKAELSEASELRQGEQEAIEAAG